jgi:hypothetical protein
MMKKKLINIFVIIFLYISGYAQIEGYKYYTTLDSINQSGFYNIVLSPIVNAHLKTDYSDVRIVNTSGKWVPHALHVPNNEINKAALGFDLKYSTTKNNKTNSIFIINENYRALNNIELSIRNTAAERYCTLSGSDNNKNWYIINDSIAINPIPADIKSTNTFRINFPLSNYKFYKLVIFNNNKDPLNITKFTTNSAFNEPFFIQNKVIQNPSTFITQKDSGKISYIKVVQQLPYHFDAISLKISAVKYFVRNLEVYVPNNPNHTFANPGKLVQSYIFTNNSNFSFKSPVLNDSVFYIIIHNNDNLPLKIDEVTTSINEHFIKAYLDAGSNYQLLMGNENATPPNYDIEKQNITQSDSAIFIQPKNVVAFEPQDKKSNSPTANTKWILWPALIIGLVILLLLTIKMIKEINKKSTNDTI